MAKKFFRTCPHCGANLDPGEVCDCLKAAPARALNTASLQELKERELVHYFREMNAEYRLLLMRSARSFAKVWPRGKETGADVPHSVGQFSLLKGGAQYE